MKNTRSVRLAILIFTLFCSTLLALPYQNRSVVDCDQIVLAKGKTIEAKVLEVNQLEVIYRKCDNNEGPVYILDLKEVNKVRYSNGTEHKVDYLNKAEEEIKTTIFWKIIGAVVVLMMAVICVFAFFGLWKAII